MAKVTTDDYIPNRDDDFYNFVKNLVKILLKEQEVDGEKKPNWEIWEIKKRNMEELQTLWKTYQELYDIAQAKKNRDSGDVDAHRQKRIGLEKFLREMVNEDIRFEKIIPREEKVRMGILPKDTEPSPVHGTDPPYVNLKNKGGAEIEVRCRRTEDQTRTSMLKGYTVEMRHIIVQEPPKNPPTDPDMSGMKTKISSKAKFKLNAGMSNLGKTLYCYFQWKHKNNAAYDGPWTNLMQITIA